MGLLVLFSLLSVAPAWSQPADEATRTAARALGTSGVEAYQAGDFVLASDKLEKAYGILRVPSIGLWSARALVQNGKWVEALDRYLEVVSLQVPTGDYAVQKQAQADSEADLAALKKRIPTIVVTTEGAPISETQITIDSRAVPSGLASEGRLVNPGRHVVEGRHAGQPARTEVTVMEGQREVALLRFGAAAAVPVAASTAPPAPAEDTGPPPDRSTLRKIGWVTLGTGVVGVGVGTVFGIMALGKKSQLDSNPACTDNRCAPAQEDNIESYNTSRTISSVGFIVGGVLTGVGVALVLSSPASKARAEAWFSPNAAGVRGRF
jgi:hypothetical protein